MSADESIELRRRSCHLRVTRPLDQTRKEGCIP